MVDSTALLSETGLLWTKKVVILDKPGQTVGNDPFEDFAETGCEADGSAGFGILGRGITMVFSHASGTKDLLYRVLKSRRTLREIISLLIKSGPIDLLFFFFVACSSSLRVR